MEQEKLTERIGFRLTKEEFRQIQRVAVGKGQKPGEWCREAARQMVAAIHAQARADREAKEREGQAQFAEPIMRAQIMQFQETIRVRILLQEFLRHYIQNTLSPEVYRQLIEQINKPDGKVAELTEKYIIAYGRLKPKPTN